MPRRHSLSSSPYVPLTLLRCSQLSASSVSACAADAGMGAMISRESQSHPTLARDCPRSRAGAGLARRGGQSHGRRPGPHARPQRRFQCSGDRWRMMEVRDLTIDYATPSGRFARSTGVSFALPPSEVLGAGRRVGLRQIDSRHDTPWTRRYLSARRRRSGAFARRGSAWPCQEQCLLRIRGRRIGFVPQNPAMALSPHLRVGNQFREVVLQHGWPSTARKRRTSRARSLRWSAWPSPTRCCAAIRTSCRADSSSGSASPWRSRAGPRYWCSTSRRPAST